MKCGPFFVQKVYLRVLTWFLPAGKFCSNALQTEAPHLKQSMNAVTVTELPDCAAEQVIRDHFAPKLELVPVAQVLPAYLSKRLHSAPNNREEHEYVRRVAVRDGLRRAA